MIILDTSIVRSLSLEGSSADLLRAIQAAGVERIAMPWMVREELAAQQAIKYQEVHERAAQAVAALHQATPWSLDTKVGNCDVKRIREHWRAKWESFVGVIPTSDEAVRQGLFREANLQPPCRLHKGVKIGGRDAAIWLSVVEYAEENPDETVYFVSSNTTDFGDGTSLPHPMDGDVAAMTDRFVVLTSMDEVASRFTEPAEADEALVAELLSSNEVLSAARNAVNVWFPPPGDPTFRCSIPLRDDESFVDQVEGWTTFEVTLGSIDDLKAYRIGDRVWCTASVLWHVSGNVAHEHVGQTWGAVSWPTGVLFNLDSDPHLAILRQTMPIPASDDVLERLHVPRLDASVLEASVLSIQRGINVLAGLPQGPGLLRAYEGALLRQSGLRMRQTSAG